MIRANCLITCSYKFIVRLNGDKALRNFYSNLVVFNEYAICLQSTITCLLIILNSYRQCTITFAFFYDVSSFAAVQS